MSKRKRGSRFWPAPPLDDAHLGAESTQGKSTSGLVVDRDWFVVVPVVPGPCKHAPSDCALCGTTERRDAAHTTVGGRGAVGRLARRR